MAHPVREYVRRISSQSLEQYPEWDLSKPLPKLPVPDLKQTLMRYLDLVAPVVSLEDYERTENLVMEFGKAGGIGEILQAKLIENAKVKENWVADLWLEDMYLKNPLALPINSSPGMVFPRQSFQNEKEQLRFAANLIAGILDYKTILDVRGLPVDRATHSRKGQPLCMEQYYRLFSSYRYPGEEKDVLLTNISRDPFDHEYIIVACNSQFFVLEITTSTDRPSEKDLYNQLRRIVRLSETEKPEEVLGILTALPRGKWASVRQHLLLDPINKKNLEIMEKSIFILCIDKAVSTAFNHYQSVEQTKLGIRDDVNCALQLLHGMGSELNGANRWYDKTMQFLISADGNCGLNYEHSVAEGIAVIRLTEHILDYMEEIKSRRLTRLSSVCDLALPKKLEWNIDPFISQMISEAKLEIEKLAANLDIYILRYEKFGREFPKTVNMSPDSFIQLALQLTHYKIHKCLVPTYESASIRRFSLGRVDNIRAASIPALKWCTAMNGDIPATDDDKIILLRCAMEWQTKVMLDTILGHGVDNHLLGLKEAAVELNMPIPELFKDKTYLESNRFRLSTSQVPTQKDAFMCYGAVVEQGYGAAYNPHKNNIVVSISCWCDCPDTRADVFAEKLKESFDEMYILLTSNLELAKNKKAARIQEIIMEENGRTETLMNHTFAKPTQNEIGKKIFQD